MSAASLACAPSGMAWDSINWSKVKRCVRWLQVRIVKAVQAGKHNKAKALQWLLTHSFSGKALAVKRVTENKGKHTPGVDKVVWKTPAAKINAVASLNRRRYAPVPLRRVLIPKKNGKTRPLGIPVMKCRAMQALHLLALEPIAETTGDSNSYGFRPQRSTADAGEQCFNALAMKASAQWVLEADIKGCFDNISHDWMIANLPTDKAILAKWLKAGFIYQDKLFSTDAGTPQGGIISPVAANMTLDGLEAILKRKYPQWKQPNLKVNMVRYADDFIITGADKTVLEDEVRPLVEQFLRERGLELSPEKTCVTHIEDGFDFLGQTVRRFGRKLLIQPSKKNTHVFLEKARGLIRRARGWNQADLIRQLNPVLRGWANYHRHIVAARTFKKVEAALWQSLWRWARRRHHQKSWSWIVSRYWHRLNGKKVFAVDTGERTPEGKTVWLRLVNVTETKVRRHVKIKVAANPFDPQWRNYFEEREFFKWYGVHWKEETDES